MMTTMTTLIADVTVSRLDWDSHFLTLAGSTALRSTCSRLQVGSVVVNQYLNVVGTGYNGAPRGVPHCVHDDDAPCRIAVHAEVNALLFSRETHGCTLYVTHCPCYDCAKLIINAGIKRMVYARAYRSIEGLDMLALGGVAFEQVNTEE